MTMDILNRSAIVLKPKQPYLEWTRLDDAEGLSEGVFETLREEPTLYLVPDWEEAGEEREILREFWPALFEAMLNGWVTDPELWPSGRTQKMFEHWFEIDTYSMVEDIYMDEAIEYVS